MKVQKNTLNILQEKNKPSLLTNGVWQTRYLHGE